MAHTDFPLLGLMSRAATETRAVDLGTGILHRIARLALHPDSYRALLRPAMVAAVVDAAEDVGPFPIRPTTTPWGRIARKLDAPQWLEWVDAQGRLQGALLLPTARADWALFIAHIDDAGPVVSPLAAKFAKPDPVVRQRAAFGLLPHAHGALDWRDAGGWVAEQNRLHPALLLVLEAVAVLTGEAEDRAAYAVTTGHCDLTGEGGPALPAEVVDVVEDGR